MAKDPHPGNGAGAAGPITLRDIDQVGHLMEKVIEDKFTELQGESITLGTFSQGGVYFRSRPRFWSLISPMGKVKYRVEVNPDIFSMALPEFAAEAIMAHELGHTAYYVRYGRFCTILAARIAISPSFHTCFERATDIDAITRGYGEGIKAYRQLIYPHLDEDQLAKKHKNYFTPAGIDAVMAGYAAFPHLREKWLLDPPLSVAEVHRDVAEAQRLAEAEPEPENV